MLIFYLILGLLLFFLESLLPLSHQIHLDLLTLFIIFVSLRTHFIVAVCLALFLGILLDCYGLAPMGLQAGILVLAVVGTKILRYQLNFLYVMPKILGVAVITIMQALLMTLLLHLLLPVPVVYPAVVKEGLLQVLVTSLSAPVVLAFFAYTEKLWRRWLIIRT